VVSIDTRLDKNGTGLRSPAEVESVIARMDLLVTTRLHGTALALKNGVPPLVIDPIAGGAKVRRQAEVLGWPLVFTADEIDDDTLQLAFDYCLSPAARREARVCADDAHAVLNEVKDQFLADGNLWDHGSGVRLSPGQ
jgi:polysaccharide pyruvyl transferase WcaK-like protein